MNILYMSYEQSERIVEDTYGEDGPYTGYTESEMEFSPLGLHKSRPNVFLVEELKPDFDISNLRKVWLVIVRYTDGGTFGTTSGNWVVKGVFKSSDLAKASALAKSIKDDTYVPAEKYGYMEWKGFFNKLDDVELHHMELKP